MKSATISGVGVGNGVPTGAPAETADPRGQSSDDGLASVVVASETGVLGAGMRTGGKIEPWEGPEAVEFYHRTVHLSAGGGRNGRWRVADGSNGPVFESISSN